MNIAHQDNCNLPSTLPPRSRLLPQTTSSGYGYLTLADVLATGSGLYVLLPPQLQLHRSADFVRPGDYNTRILLLVDGHRLNDKDYDPGDAGVRVPGRYWPGQHIEIVLFQSGFTHQVPNNDLSEEKRGSVARTLRGSASLLRREKNNSLAFLL